MTFEILSALVLFAFVSSITPGPNNLMLMSSGANFGFKLTLPHLFGVCCGFTFMVILVGLGMTQLFDAFPYSYTVLRIFSVIYLLYLAYKIASSNSTIANKTTGNKPITFLQAVAFQWVNPKAWSMALTAISVYAPSQTLAAVLFVGLVFGLINLPCITSWTIVGLKIRRFLNTDIRLKIFNFTMAGLLVFSLYPILL